jgi:hypothetical protein
MSRIKYANIKIGAERLAVVDQATEICEEYAQQGLSLTLRQVYYQFVARGLMDNKQQNYKRLGDILNDARMAGLFDWDYMIDRTRNLVSQPHWESPRTLINAVSEQYRTDLWKTQKQRVEVWIEKDAGIGVIEAVCEGNNVPYFACRGYTSASEMWAASQRVGDYLRRGDRVTILHIGDHDPSGLDMTRDMQKRLATFVLNDWKREFMAGMTGITSADIYDHMRRNMTIVGGNVGPTQAPFRLKRIALSYAQVQQYAPPPNPAKTTDSRFEAYMAETGLDESWELDALDPRVLQDLIQAEIDLVKNEDTWDEAYERQERERALLRLVSQNWTEVTDNYRDQIPGADDDEDDDRG